MTGPTALLAPGVYDTLAAPESAQFALWEEWVCRLHGQMSFERFAGAPYAGRLSVRRGGQMQLVRFRGQRAVLSRSALQVRQDCVDQYEIVAPLLGEVTMTHNHRRIRLRTGQFTLVDSTRPMRLEHSGELSAVTLALPHRLLHERLPDLEDACGEAFGAQHPLAVPALAFLGAVSDAMTELDEHSIRRTSAQLLDLFAMVIEGEGDLLSAETAVQAATLRRIKRFIRAELVNDALSLPMIAAAAGVSVRYVQNLFRSAGLAAREYILKERLRRVREALMDASQAGSTITQIAGAAGFRNMSHFSTAFKRAYGCTPSDVRPSRSPSPLR